MLSSQFEAIKMQASAVDATNYAVFILVMFVFLLVMIAHFLVLFMQHRTNVQRPSALDFIFILLVLALCPVPLFTDFYVDAFGLYYLKQYFLFLVLPMAILTILASALAALRRA